MRWRRAGGCCSPAWPRELGGPDRALAVACDVTEWGDQAAPGRVGPRALRRIDAAGPRERRLRRQARLPGGVASEHWREMVLTNVYGAALTIVGQRRRAAREPRAPVADRLGGRPQGRPRVALLLHEVGRDGHVGGRPPRAARQRGARDPPLARNREDAFYDDPVGGDQLSRRTSPGR